MQNSLDIIKPASKYTRIFTAVARVGSRAPRVQAAWPRRVSGRLRRQAGRLFTGGHIELFRRGRFVPAA